MRRRSALKFSFAATTLAGCLGGGSGESASAQTDGGGGAADATPDAARPRDLGAGGGPDTGGGGAPDASDPGDGFVPPGDTALPVTDAAPPPPDAAPPVPDAALAPFAHCGPWGPPPTTEAGLSVEAAGLRLACPDFELFLTGASHAVGYERLDDRRAPRLGSTALTAAKLDDPLIWRASATDLTACLEHGTVVVSRADCTLTLRAPDGTMLYETAPTSDVVRVEPGTGPDDGAQVRVMASASRVLPGAAVYGCGQHTGPLNRAGTRFTHWNTDAYDPAHGGWAPDADPLYASLPFCTLLGAGASLGVFVDEPRRTEFDLGAMLADTWRIQSHGTPTTWLMPGVSLAEPALAYRRLTGAAARPPRWAFGFQQSRWGYDTADDVRRLAREFRDRTLPVDVLWLDIQHMDGFRTFTFDPLRFADPARLTADLSAMGVRTVAIADPGLKVDPAWPVYSAAREASLFLQNLDGTDFVGNVWAGPSSFLDFTLPDARAFWARHIGGLRTLGFAGIWLDVNEPTTFPEGGAGLSVPNTLAVRGPIFGAGAPAATMAEAHNLYGLLEAQASYEGLQAAAPGERPLVVGRAAYAGIHRFAGLWTGDTPSTWPALRQTLPMLLNLGVAGVPYVGSDVGGYSGHATPELYARWLQLGVLSPFFRAHVTNGVPGQEPWQFGQEVTDLSREWLRERMRLVPYFEALALTASLTGAPPLRPLAWEFPNSPNLAGVEDQAMLGPFVLAAPVMNEDETLRRVTLPPGRWVEYASGHVLAGGAVHEQSVTRAALPLYLREGALLLRAASPADHTDALTVARRLDVVPGAESTQLVAPGANDDADIPGEDRRLTFAQAWDGRTLTVDLAAGASVSLPEVEVVVRLLDAAPSEIRWNGAALPAEAYTLDLNDRTLHVPRPAGAGGRLSVELTAPLPDDGTTVSIELTVDVPEGTPVDAPVTVAGTFNDWMHSPLPWVEPGRRARGTVRVPRGQWYEFKFARGGWETVEKWPACEEAENRYAFGAANPSREERVFAWRDQCE